MRHEPLFVYGTLQFPAIASAVTGRRLAGVPATLDGYGRFAVHDAPYPGIVPQAGGRVEGLLYFDLDPQAWRRIDAFEGELYRREAVTARRLDDDTALAAQAYVVRPRWRSALSRSPWDPAHFERHWHERYAQRGVGT